MEDINQGISLYKSTPNAVLIDLRDAEDYAEGHIPGAVNMLPKPSVSRLPQSLKRIRPSFFTAMAVCAAIRPKPCSRPEAISMSAVSAESTDMMENWKNE